MSLDFAQTQGRRSFAGQRGEGGEQLRGERVAMYIGGEEKKRADAPTKASNATRTSEIFFFYAGRNARTNFDARDGLG